MIWDLIASLSFYLVPFLTGRFFTKSPVVAWAIGALIWFVAFFVATLSGNFEGIIKYAVISVSIVSAINLVRNLAKDRPKINAKDFLVYLTLISVATASYFLVWKRSTPYPMQLNWDIYEHITLANEIAKGRLALFTTQISDTFTFNSYSPIFGALLALPKIIFGKSLIGVYWWLEYWHFLFTALASFLLARRVFKDKWIALTAGIISIFTFESLVAYSTLFLIPQTLAVLLTVFLLSEEREKRPLLLILASITAFLTHYIVGVLCLFILLSFYLIKRINLPKRLLNVLIFVSTLIALGLAGLSFLGNWQLLDTLEASHFNFTLMEKGGYLMTWYGVALLIFAIIGCIKIIRGGTSEQKIILSISIFTLGLAMAPFSYFLKFYVPAHYLVGAVIAAGFGALMAGLPRIVKALSLAFLTGLMLVIFYENQLSYKEPLHFKQYETQVSYAEIEAGKWLSTYEGGKDAILISDPSLAYILEATSGVNTQGGTYMRYDTRKVLSGIKSSNNSARIKLELLRVRDSLPVENREVFFAVGGRYFDWQRMSDAEKENSFSNVWSPREIREQDRSYIEFLKNSPEFEVIYENSEIVILKVI